jgi:hypothetical protein
VQNTDTLGNTGRPIASAEEKQRRKETRAKFLDRIRDSLGTVREQMAFSPTEAGLVCGKSATWAYRAIYRGDFRCTNSGGRLMIPRFEIEKFMARADRYDPEPRKGGEGDGNSRK